MENKFIEIQPLLPHSIFKQIKDLALSQKIEWTYCREMSGSLIALENFKAKDDNIINDEGFISLFYQKGTVNKPIYKEFKIINPYVEKALGKPISTVYSLKTVYTYPKPNNTNNYTCPHTDNFTEGSTCKTLLLYLNESDGNTILFDTDKTDSKDDYSKKNILTEIKPNENKALLFNSNIYHAIHRSSNHSRFVLVYIFD